jgi:hypothetical protein
MPIQRTNDQIAADIAMAILENNSADARAVLGWLREAAQPKELIKPITVKLAMHSDLGEAIEAGECLQRAISNTGLGKLFKIEKMIYAAFDEDMAAFRIQTAIRAQLARLAVATLREA